MASLTQWTWVWASSGRWWRTGRSGVLQSCRIRHNWATEQQQRSCFFILQAGIVPCNSVSQVGFRSGAYGPGIPFLWATGLWKLWMTIWAQIHAALLWIAHNLFQWVLKPVKNRTLLRLHILLFFIADLTKHVFVNLFNLERILLYPLTNVWFLKFISKTQHKKMVLVKFVKFSTLIFNITQVNLNTYFTHPRAYT